MKKYIILMLCFVAITHNKISFGYSTADQVHDQTPMTSPIVIINASAVPLTFTNPTATGAFCYAPNSIDTSPRGSYGSCTTYIAGTPLTVPSRTSVTPAQNLGIITDGAGRKWQTWQAYDPTSTASQGWNGKPIVSHKGVNTTISGPGFWIFSDTGIYRADGHSLGFIN